MRMRSTVVALGLAALAGIAAGPATVTIDQAVRTGDDVAVSGTADLGEDGRHCTVADSKGKVTAFTAPQAADTPGLDLKDACIERTEDGLKFIWVLASPLPAQVPPEAVRYNWSMQVGAQTLQLQAKRTNVANATTVEDPAGHAQHLSQDPQAGWFQVRGACVAEYFGTPINGCYHLDFVDGGFDIEAGEVWMELPFDPKDNLGRSYAPEFTDGTTVVESASAGMSIAASGQAVVSNTYSSSYINGWSTYCTADQLTAGLGKSTIGTADMQPVTLAEDGSWATTLTGTGDYVHASACNGFLTATDRVKLGEG